MFKYFLIIILLLIFYSCSKINYIYNLFHNKIENKKLILISIKDKNITKLTQNRAYIILNKNYTFKGFSACNDFNGTFILNKEFIHFKINNINSKVCKNIYIQHNFLENLVQTNKIIIKNKKLYYFVDLNNTTLLVFKN